MFFCHYRNQKNSTDKERQTAKGCKRKLPVFYKHNHHNRNDRNKVRNQSGNGIFDNVLERVRVTDNSRKNFSGRTRIKKRKVQSLNVVVQFLAQLLNNLVTCLCHQKHTKLDCKNRKDVDCCTQQYDSDKSWNIARKDVAVNGTFIQKRIHEVYRSTESHQRKYARNSFLIFKQVTEKSWHRFEVRFLYLLFVYFITVHIFLRYVRWLSRRSRIETTSSSAHRWFRYDASHHSTTGLP